MLPAVTVISEYSRLHRVYCCCTANSLHIIKVFLSLCSFKQDEVVEWFYAACLGWHCIVATS